MINYIVIYPEIQSYMLQDGNEYIFGRGGGGGTSTSRRGGGKKSARSRMARAKKFVKKIKKSAKSRRR